MSDQKARSILLINDLAGYGKVALSAMMPILSHMKYELYTLPTAVVSNTLDYGQFEILDTTAYIEKTLKVWDNLGFQFQAIATGFLASEEEARILSVFCQEQKEKGTWIFVDPIMGDEGKLYNGIGAATVDYMKKLVSTASLIKPNYTEACYLTGETYQPDGISMAEGRELLDKLRALGAESIVITSIPIEGKKCCMTYDARDGEYACMAYNEIPVRFPGTGDIFSAIVTGEIMDGVGLEAAAQKAMAAVKTMIERSLNNQDKYLGIPVEQHLDLLDTNE